MNNTVGIDQAIKVVIPDKTAFVVKLQEDGWRVAYFSNGDVSLLTFEQYETLVNMAKRLKLLKDQAETTKNKKNTVKILM